MQQQGQPLALTTTDAFSEEGRCGTHSATLWALLKVMRAESPGLITKALDLGSAQAHSMRPPNDQAICLIHLFLIITLKSLSIFARRDVFLNMSQAINN